MVEEEVKGMLAHIVNLKREIHTRRETRELLCHGEPSGTELLGPNKRQVRHPSLSKHCNRIVLHTRKSKVAFFLEFQRLQGSRRMAIVSITGQ